jgi:hypothetical protein
MVADTAARHLQIPPELQGPAWTAASGAASGTAGAPTGAGGRVSPVTPWMEAAAAGQAALSGRGGARRAPQAQLLRPRQAGGAAWQGQRLEDRPGIALWRPPGQQVGVSREAPGVCP